jgi:flagellar basal-body rod protein FlgC
MGLFTGIDISGSGLTAQRLRMDIISNNIANQGTTRSGQVDANGKPVPYRREFPIFQAGASFGQFLESAVAGMEPPGVSVVAVDQDTSPFPMVYNPNSPDANAQGYVQMPNVNMTQEMVDMIDASRAYDANISSLNASKDMCSRALTIGQ